MAYTVGTFFYRSDLIKPTEVPKTWAELVSTSQRLQKEGKVKWGYVGGMSFNNTWFSLWWSMWSNNCDIFLPLFERDAVKLKANGFKSAIAEPCHKQVVEFWWDALKANKISPEAMTSYGRNEANAIFMAGDAAFTLVTSRITASSPTPTSRRSSARSAWRRSRWDRTPRRRRRGTRFGAGEFRKRLAGGQEEAGQGDARRDDA